MSEDVNDFMRRFSRGARERFAAIPPDAVVMTMWIVYDHPRDYPEGYVVRAWHIVRGQTEPVPDPASWSVATLELARLVIPEGLVNIGRQPGDDNHILEVWT
jgi:hypothetical protein